MPNTARGATTVIFPAPQRAEVVQETVDEPGPNQVLIQGRASLISAGTELTAYGGHFPPHSGWSRYVQYPFVAGYAHAGVVLSVGRDVISPRVGERVASQAPHTTLACRDADDCCVVPDAVSDEEATFWTLGKIVMNAVRIARVTLGETVVVIGAGLLGQLAVSLSLLSGAYRVICVDLAPARLAHARAQGATDTICADVAAAREEVRALLDGALADCVFEVTGHPEAVPAALRLARRRGRIILLGSSRGPTTIDFHDEAHSLGLQILGAHSSTAPQAATPDMPWTPCQNGTLFLKLLAARRLHVADLITHRYALAEAPAAYALLAADRTRAMGVLLTYGGT